MSSRLIEPVVFEGLKSAMRWASFGANVAFEPVHTFAANNCLKMLP